MATSPEVKAITECTDKLVMALSSDLTSISSKLLAKGIISRGFNKKMLLQTNPEDVRSGELVSCVSNRIEGNPQVFHQFVEILKEEPHLGDSVKMLNAAYTSLKPQDAVRPGKSSPLIKRTQLKQQDMERKFAIVMSKTLRSINSRHISPKELATCLLLFNAYDPERKQQPLLKDHKDKLLKAKTNETIFLIVRQYVSFVDPELLEYIIESYELREVRDEYRDYMKSLDEFSENPVVPPCRLNDVQANEYQGKIKMKFDQQDKKLVRFRRVKLVVAKIIGVKKEALKMDEINKGSLEVTFLVPKFVIEHIFPLTSSQQHELSDLGVLSVDTLNLQLTPPMPKRIRVQTDIEVSQPDDHTTPSTPCPPRSGEQGWSLGHNQPTYMSQFFGSTTQRALDLTPSIVPLQNHSPSSNDIFPLARFPERSLPSSGFIGIRGGLVICCLLLLVICCFLGGLLWIKGNGSQYVKIFCASAFIVFISYKMFR